MITAIDPATVELIGLDGLRRKWGLTQSGIYSQGRRGKLGEPDWRVAVTPKSPKGVPVWLAVRFGEQAGEVDLTPYPGELPALLGLEEVAVCMDVKRHTVETMRTRGRKDIATPEPYTTIGQTPVWWADAWRTFADATRRPFDLDRLAEYRRALAVSAT
ncbi:hypothetical protein [Nonomuraea rubra]|uniref:hypothetical protein n=1 Tax=Nonomuraea rubra TaxID=46180 RepID=UPI0033E93205